MLGLEILFRDLQRDTPLWPSSDDRFRKRFRTVLELWGLETNRAATGFNRSFNAEEDSSGVLHLALLRAGGATDLYLATEDPPLVQLRGGWLDQKVMLVYLQEVASVSYMAGLSPAVRHRVHAFASISGYVWAIALRWVRDGLPLESIPEHWYRELILG